MSLYFEAHVVYQCSKDSVVCGNAIVATDDLGFWLSEIAVDFSGEEEDGDVIATRRHEDENVLLEFVAMLVVKLKRLGLKVKRYKIEAATVDSNREDILGLLT